ncbi:hypothetical protein [Mammaliicoccus vitulinus]|uniref:hypothetical protein n=1 Tax=Mammaliicoccus vitulinus TaxID=71237 RepID=UPI003BA390FA
MNLSKKIVLGALTAGILASPLVTTPNQADAAEQKMAQPDNTDPGQKVTLDENEKVDYYIKGSNALEEQEIAFNLDEKNYRTYYPGRQRLAKYIESTGETVDSNKVYHFKLDPVYFDATGGLITFGPNSINYIGSTN